MVSPGYQFGPSGLGHFRICYAREEVSWDQALDRMVAALTAVAEGAPVTTPQTVTVVIASPLEPEHVATIRAVDERLEVLYEPAFLATPRYVADHGGELPELTAEQDRRWHAMLARADVSFDFDRREPERASANFPRLQWIQATSAGVGQVVPRFDLDLSRVVVTTAAGVHAVPLAEFAVAALLHFAKGFPQLRQWQQEHRWTRYTSRNLAGSARPGRRARRRRPGDGGEAGCAGRARDRRGPAGRHQQRPRASPPRWRSPTSTGCCRRSTVSCWPAR